MAEFKDIAQGFNRMCSFYDTPPCEGCPMGFHTIDRSDCMSRLFCNPEKYEERIIKWSEKHPEPKYPTWAEYLVLIGVYPPDTTIFQTPLKTPIPAGIAEKLGLKPKEM